MLLEDIFPSGKNEYSNTLLVKKLYTMKYGLHTLKIFQIYFLLFNYFFLLLNNKLSYFSQVEKQEFGLKPMNCPGHCLMFEHRVRSYRGG